MALSQCELTASAIHIEVGPKPHKTHARPVLRIGHFSRCRVGYHTLHALLTNAYNAEAKNRGVAALGKGGAFLGIRYAAHSDQAGVDTRYSKKGAVQRAAPSMVRPVRVWAWLDLTRLDKPRLGLAWRGAALRGLACLDLAGRGLT